VSKEREFARIMSLQKAPAITGVSADRQSELTRVYPSVGGTGIGMLFGRWYESIPARIGGIKLSYLLFVLPTAIVVLPLFFILKAIGDVYVLTNRSVQRRASLGNRLKSEVLLTAIDDVVVRQESGQEFYPCSDLYLVGKTGETLMSLPGVIRGDVFRQNIIEARNARRQVEASLSTINARQPATA
jgi:hypothetical protein